MAHCYKDELIEKAKQLAENKATYTIPTAYWVGKGWIEEKGYFTEDGVYRFAYTQNELFETYDEIDEQVLEECIYCVDGGDDVDDESETTEHPVYVYVSQFEHGDEFEGDVIVDAYATNQEAQERLKNDYKQVKEMFLNCYDEYDLHERFGNDSIILYSKAMDDYWEGSVHERVITIHKS